MALLFVHVCSGQFNTLRVVSVAAQPYPTILFLFSFCHIVMVVPIFAGIAGATAKIAWVVKKV